MKRLMTKTLSIILVITLLITLMPLSVLTARAAEAETLSLKNAYIEAVVSKENGGFLIRTVEGNKLAKDDNNKNLLYHNGQYDTSFTSFRVDYGSGVVRDYLFGGSYGFLGLSSSDVTVTQDTTGIMAVWSVDDLTFTQRIELSALNSNEHGMASITYSVKNNGSKPVESVKVRVLLDSCLGNRDYGYYQIPTDSTGTLETVQKERVFNYGPSDFVPATLYAIDDAMIPTMTAYSVNSTSPYQIAFGHWNNLASSLFDFSPDSSLEFTNPYNEAYLTADSAYALYYSMEDIGAGGQKNISTYYGVYANASTSAGDDVAINITAPTALRLSGDKKSYLPSDLALGGANIGVEAKINNFIKEVATNYSEVTVALYTPPGITPLNEGGGDLGRTYSPTDPYRIIFSDFESGQTRATTFQMKADVGSAATYRKIEIRAFDTSSQSLLTEQNLLGATTFYVLCPGGDGDLPKILFSGGDPGILYNQGTRHFFVTGQNFSMLGNKAQYTLYIESLTNPSVKHLIEPQYITFPEKPEGNILDVIITQDLPVGQYQLVFYWEDSAIAGGIVSAADKVMTAPSLKVIMSDDPAYKNDTYGVMIVYQKPGKKDLDSEYEIKSFRNEDEFQSFEANPRNYEEILIILRGAFEIDTKLGGEPVSWTATVGKASLVNGKVNQSTIVTLNNCIDFENGTLTLHYDGNNPANGSILVDFDGDLYTSDARTSIWKGKAALTAIKNKAEYSLVPYNKDGTLVLGFADKPITLLWPSALGMAQTLGGLVFNLSYGKLGVMYDRTDPHSPVELGRVLSFSANLDLGFLVPAGAKADGANTGWNRIKEAFSLESGYLGLRTRYDRFVQEPSDEDKENIKDAAGQASVMVDNILFGCGSGYIGFRCDAKVRIPAYTTTMPTMLCNLKINTIGDWSFGVRGNCKFTTMEVEVEIGIKSKNNIPIPDKLYFYVSGFEPGINVDGVGVLWITGGGGGIENLYDTIFAGDKLPPLKILLSVHFDIIKVLSSRVDMSLGLRGLSFSANDVKIKYTNIMVLDKARLQFDWYPDWYFQASIKMSLFDAIVGSGYIVVIDNAQYDKFFEFFVRAALRIPSYIPILGGFEVGGVDLGINTEKIWGVARIIGIKFGVVYFWDGGFDWGTGAGSTSPTFPGLLGYESVPVYYDEETGQTLRMAVGTNLNVLAMAEIGESLEEMPQLLGVGAYLRSTADKKSHELNLGEFSPSGEVFTITYNATSLEDAQAKAAAMTIKSGGADYGVVQGVNSNVTYDKDSGKGTLAVSATKSEQYNRTWEIDTKVSADIVLYGVSAIPEITSVSHTITGSQATVQWAGSSTSKLDRLDFYLTTDPGTGTEITDMGTLIGSLNNAEIAAATTGSTGTKTFTLSGDLQTDDYYIKAIYTREGTVSGSKTSLLKHRFENTHQPTAPVGVTVANGGDSTFKVAVGNNANTDYDAYMLNVYEYDQDLSQWVLSNVNNIIYSKQEQLDQYGNGTGVMLPITNMSIGGTYRGFDEKVKSGAYGLTGGKSYKVGVTAVKNVTDGSGNHLYSVSSKETISPEITLATPTPPTVTLGNKSTFTPVARMEWVAGGSQKANYYDTSNSNDMAFRANSNVPVTGNWDIDGDYTSNINTATSGLSGSFTGETAIDINLADMPDGDHTLTVWGTDAEGDSFRVQKVFTVDTQPPKLLIDSPLNGGYFTETGDLQISGVTDKDALFSIAIDGNGPKPQHQNKTIAELGGTIDSEGVFSFSISLDPGKSSHKLLLIAKDEVGNFMRHEVTVKNQGLANISSLDLYMSDGVTPPVEYSNQNIPISPERSTQAEFSLVANTLKGRQIVITDEELVDWSAFAVKGTASISEDGVLSAGPDSVGYVTGGLKVAQRGAMTASATFGAERYAGTFQVVLGSTVGGTVTGEGYYKPGETVTIKAVPLSGYVFKGWATEDVTLTGNTATTTFTMPLHDVTITASFVHASNADEEDDDDGSSSQTWYASKGNIATIPLPVLPVGANPDLYVPCYKGPDGKAIIVPFSVAENGKLIFIAPANDHYFVKEIKGGFRDIEGHWGKNDILFAMARGLFVGDGQGKFNPNGTMNRAMLVAVLYRLMGSPAVTGNSFIDVPEEAWYADAVTWAHQNGLVAGYNNGKFGPLDNITREQMVTILYRFMEWLDKNITADGDLSAYTDSGRIAVWAREAVAWGVGTKLIQGYNETLDPSGNATRAQSCAMLTRFIKLILLGKK